MSFRAAHEGAATDRSEAARDRRRIEITLDALRQDWKTAFERATRYLRALGRSTGADTSEERLAAEAVERASARTDWPPEKDAFTETLAWARRLTTGGGDDDPERFLRWRLGRAFGDRPVPSSSTPTLARRSMTPNRIRRRGLGHRIVAGEGFSKREVHARRRRLPWVSAARRRRWLLAFLVLIPTVIASQFMLDILPRQGNPVVQLAIVAVFGVLFGWISIGFWMAMAGFFLLLLRRDRFVVGPLPPDPETPVAPDARTAVIMPICEEPVERVFAGLRSIHRSLARTGSLPCFDFFVLSDTADPDTAIREEEEWLRWCRDEDALGRVFYRRRRVRIRRKSGNVADFCRRFGRRYRYMIVLDADSIMSGRTLERLVRLMESRPDAGLIQTVPVPVRARSLHGRMQQFANRLYAPLFAAGLHFFQLGDAQFWGHNAIIRIEPFMRHCALPRLPGRPPLGGEILSHDFVEAALMGRAGWSVWVAYELEGSYEELPSSLLEDLQRDRRWCQGNLQHLRLVLTEGLFGAHRALFLNGVLAYVSALLWFLFLSLGTAAAILQALVEPDYFPAGRSLFPEWPIWRPDWAVSLLAVSLAILFLPKLLGVVVVLVRPVSVRAFGGFARLVASVLLEILLSALFAPIRMVFHTKFVLTNLAGRTVTWRSQSRDERETSWSEAVRRHGATTVVASLWGLGVYWLNPEYFWWLTPIVGALVLSVPLSVLTSRVSAGEGARAAGLFLTPEETEPPGELRELDDILVEMRRAAELLPSAERSGFVRAIVDPYTNALHRMLVRGPRRLRESVRQSRRRLVERVLDAGPDALDDGERRRVLLDPENVDTLHRETWQLSDPERARLWGRPGG